MSRFWTSLQTLLLTAVALTIAGATSADYVNPIDMVDLRVCTGETPAQDGTTPHNDPGVWDKCRTSASWTNSANVTAGDVVQTDLFFTINNMGLLSFSLSLYFDEQNQNALDMRALSVYNISKSNCIPQGNPEVNDGGCEELGDTELALTKFVAVEGEGETLTRTITIYDPDGGAPQPIESTGSSLGALQSMFALSLNGVSSGTKNQHPVIRIGTLWFDVNAVSDGTNTSVRPVMIPGGSDAIGDVGFSVLDPTFDADWECTTDLATCNAANRPYWRSSNITVPEPAVALIQFGAISALGWLASRRKR